MEKGLLTIAKQFIKQHAISIKRDQFFLIDTSVIDKLIQYAHIGNHDRVLEIGPGLGLLTKVIAKTAKEVVAIELDERFKPYLAKLPKNVEIIYGDAYQLLNNKEFLRITKPPTKIISNIPYSQAQNMLHNYTNSHWYANDLVWIAPLSLVNKVNKEPILGAYFRAEAKERISKSAFYPEPNTTSAIVYFKRIPNPVKTGDFEIYLRRWFYNHEGWKVKNALREGVINAAYDLKAKRVTRNQARQIIYDLRIPEQELEKLTNNMKPDYYFSIPKNLQPWFNNL